MSVASLSSPVLAVVPIRRLLFHWILSFFPQILLLLAALLLLLLAFRLRHSLRQHLAAGGPRRWTVFLLISALVILLAGSLCLVSRPSRPLASSSTDHPGVSVGPWPTFMGSSRRTGAAPGTDAPQVGARLWSFRDGLARAPFAGSPAVFGDRVFVGSDNGKLYCFDAFTGSVLWTFKARYELFSSPVVADGRVYLGEGLHDTAGAALYCLDASSGKPLWTFPTTSHIEFSPTLFHDKLYFGAGDDGLYCLDARSGQKLWHHPGTHVDMSPAVTREGVFFGNVYGDPHVISLDPDTGRLLWEKAAPAPVCGSPSTDGDLLCFGLGNGTFEMSHAHPVGSVWCLSTRDGKELWHADVPDAVLTTVALWEGAGFFGSRDGRLYCVDLKSGRIRWSFDTGAPVLSSPAVVGGFVYFGSDNGRVYCLHADSGKPLWSYDTSEASFVVDARVISSPAVAIDRVFVGSTNFFFFCLGTPAPDAPTPAWPR